VDTTRASRRLRRRRPRSRFRASDPRRTRRRSGSRGSAGQRRKQTRRTGPKSRNAPGKNRARCQRRDRQSGLRSGLRPLRSDGIRSQVTTRERSHATRNHTASATGAVNGCSLQNIRQRARPNKSRALCFSERQDSGRYRQNESNAILESRFSSKPIFRTESAELPLLEPKSKSIYGDLKRGILTAFPPIRDLCSSTHRQNYRAAPATPAPTSSLVDAESTFAKASAAIGGHAV